MTTLASAPSTFYPQGDPVGTTGSALAVTGAAALPTAGGAELLFTLSAPAAVTVCVRNIAGRPIKTLCHAKDREPGTNTLLCQGRSDQSLPVPNGTYLVEINARAPDGTQARGLAQVSLRR